MLDNSMSIYENSEIKYRRAVQEFKFVQTRMRFKNREMDYKKCKNKLRKEELEGVLRRFEAAAADVPHGVCYKLCNGPAIAIVSAALALVGLVVAGAFRSYSIANPWIVVLAIMLPLLIGLVLFMLVCNCRVQQRKQKYEEIFARFSELAVMLTQEYQQKVVFFRFDHDKQVLQIDYQTNDPLNDLLASGKPASPDASPARAPLPAQPLQHMEQQKRIASTPTLPTAAHSSPSSELVYFCPTFQYPLQFNNINHSFTHSDADIPSYNPQNIIFNHNHNNHRKSHRDHVPVYNASAYNFSNYH